MQNRVLVGSCKLKQTLSLESIQRAEFDNRKKPKTTVGLCFLVTNYAKIQFQSSLVLWQVFVCFGCLFVFSYRTNRSLLVSFLSPFSFVV